MKTLRGAIAALSLVTVVGIAVWESGQLNSPGTLHPSHAGVGELWGRRGCQKCHGDAQVALADACLRCHEAIGTQLSERRGLHGTLDGGLRRACARCHVEHTGGAVALVSDTAFAAAGIPDVSRYDHRHVAEYALVDRHVDLACERCHTPAGDQLRQGERRFLGLSQTCTACHKDVHKGTYGGDCAECHGQAQPFDRVARFAHAARFPLAGGHGELACKRCHTEGTRYAIAALRADRPAAVRRCVACHRPPHDETFARRVAAQAEGHPDARDTCAICHDAQHGAFLSPPALMPRPLHAASGFALDTPHDKLQCRECHADMGHRKPLEDGPDLPVRFAALFPARPPTACESCHADPHRGQFDARPSHGRCIECHDAKRFFPARFDYGAHANARFALTGAHEAVGCRNCHTETDGVRTFVGVATACAQCHKDVHAGLFDGPGKPAAVHGRRGCARCHGTASFRTVEWTQDEHAQWTGYALAGAHRKATCTACHRPEPRGAGEIVRLGKAPTACAQCHADPHLGQFTQSGQTDCARCHADARPFTETTFDHNRDSRFALDATHRPVACAACHRPARTPDGRTVVRYRPLGSQCQDCHRFKTATERPA